MKKNYTAANQLIIVNVSTLAAIQAFPSFGIYCMAKAAREMFHKVLAEEQKSTPENGIKVLNYAPGPLDTDMQTQIREGEQVDKATQVCV